MRRRHERHRSGGAGDGSYGINIFANGIDTRTRGADLVFDFPFEYSFGKVDWSISATYNDTTITKYATTPPQLVPNVLYDQEAYSELTTATPKYVINLGALWTNEKLQVNLVEQIWGPSSDYENDDGDNPTGNFQYFEDKINLTATTNLDVSYLFTDKLKLAVGAENLFNRFPNKLNSNILTREDRGLRQCRRDSISAVLALRHQRRVLLREGGVQILRQQ